MAKELSFKLWDKGHLTISCLFHLTLFYSNQYLLLSGIFSPIPYVFQYMRILVFPLIRIPWTNFLLQLVLWLRVLAAKVQADLAGLLPPLLPCYITGFQSLLGLLSHIFVAGVFSMGLILMWVCVVGFLFVCLL